MEHLHTVILAGGSGTRLWPLSTPSFPKQFLPLPNGNSLIQESLARVAPLVSPEQTWVVTGRSMADLVHEHLPSVPLPHILGEPMGRSTAPAIGWAAANLVAAISKGTGTTALTNGQITRTSDETPIPTVLVAPMAVDKTNILPTVIADGYVHVTDVCQGLPKGIDGVCP